jgi:hypothetical protein
MFFKLINVILIYLYYFTHLQHWCHLLVLIEHVLINFCFINIQVILQLLGLLS